ncbi:MAG: hypothetical protein ACI9FN_001767 [Saprospiraceae bacterium]|jgi:hypothetical protein
MRIIFILWVISLGVQHSKAQSDSLSIHLRSVSLVQANLIEALNLNKEHNSTFSFSKSAFRKNLPKYKTTAFFCVLEDKILNTSNVPIRMRLGSLDYTNSMEGKNPFDIELSNALTIPH